MTRELQGYAFWHPDTGCEWHSAMIRLPQLTASASFRSRSRWRAMRRCLPWSSRAN